MLKAAHKMLDSMESMNDPITSHYDHWMNLNNEHGSLKDALKNHVSALYWAERQLAIEESVKPKRQRKPAARDQFILTLKAIYKRHNSPYEMVDFNDNQGAFVTDTREVFDL